MTFNGMEVDTPHIKLWPIEEFQRQGAKLVFAQCDRTVSLAFEILERNEAGEWFIVNAETGYRITYTMASFWSVHMWNWIEKHRPFWYDVYRSIEALRRRLS